MKYIEDEVKKVFRELLHCIIETKEISLDWNIGIKECSNYI